MNRVNLHSSYAIVENDADTSNGELTMNYKIKRKLFELLILFVFFEVKFKQN